MCDRQFIDFLYEYAHLFPVKNRMGIGNVMQETTPRQVLVVERAQYL